MRVYSLNDTLPLGYAGENEAREIAIDICQLVRTWPDLRPELVARRPGETDVYPCRTRVEDGVLIWTVTGADTAKSGEGEARVYMLDGEGKIAKSRIVKTLIRGGMEGEMREEMPDAAAPWVDNVLDAGSKTEAAAQRAENAAQNAEGAAAAAAWDVFDANVFIVRAQEEDPTYADKTHIEINLAAGDRKVILYVDGQGRPHNYMGRMPSLIDSTVMTQTFGRPVEYTDGRISWQIAQILPDGKIIKRGNAQLKAPNPYKLMISGAVTAQYDGKEQVNIHIPTIEGPQGEPGADGFSPTVTLTREADGVVITATNKDGETSEKVYDGKDGAGGEGGGLPEGGEPHQMLVTDGEGNAKWDERTHWKEEGLIDCYPEAVVSGNGVQYPIATPFAQPLVEGETYTVTINGVDHVSTAKAFTNEGITMILLGNTSGVGGEDTGEPYYLMYIPPEYASLAGAYGMLGADVGGASEVMLRVWKDGTIYHKLAPEFLPIPMVDVLSDYLKETTLPIDPEEGMGAILEPFAKPLAIGETYTVTWNGTKYTCTAWAYSEGGEALIPALGNGAALDEIFPASDDPFLVVYVPNELLENFGAHGVVFPFDGSESVTLSIQGAGGGVKIDNSALDMDWVAKYDNVGETIVAETVGQGNGAEVAAADTSFFVEGNSFIAYVDNVRYDLTVVNYEGQLAAGNLGLVVPGAPGNGEPFYITAKEGKLTFFRAWGDDNDALHTIAVYLPGSSQRVPNQKLPNAFLPGAGVYYVDLANGEVNRGFDEIVSAYNLGRTVCCRVYDDMITDSKLYYLTRVAVYNGKIYFSSFLDGEMTEITIDRYDREAEKYNKVTIRGYDLNLPSAEGVGF